MEVTSCALVSTTAGKVTIECQTKPVSGGGTTTPPQQPAICASAPLVLTPRSLPAAALGKSEVVFFTASQNIKTYTVSKDPFSLKVTDDRRCTATITK